mgnify:FL=1
MMTSLGTALVLVAALTGSAMPCPPGSLYALTEAPLNAQVAARASDTATVRLRISGMTCGSCPATARLALRRLGGVYSATVTLDDSLGVVRYDSRRVTPAQIAAHLTRLTGYGATVVPDTTAASRRPDRR